MVSAKSHSRASVFFFLGDINCDPLLNLVRDSNGSYTTENKENKKNMVHFMVACSLGRNKKFILRQKKQNKTKNLHSNSYFLMKA